MKIEELIRNLKSIKKELQDKEIVIIAPNGLMFRPRIKFSLKDKMKPLELTKENVGHIIITY